MKPAEFSSYFFDAVLVYYAESRETLADSVD